jgi:hypothetical protein
VLTGVAIGGVLGSLMNQPETVIVQQPVYAAPAAYYAPAPVAVAPGPGYYVEAAPVAPVYVQPAPVYVQPPPVYYYAPRPVYQVRYW